MWTYFACSFFVPYMYVIKSIIKLGHQNIGLVTNILTKIDKGKRCHRQNSITPERVNSTRDWMHITVN